MATILFLPNEIILHIFSHIDNSLELLKLHSLSKRFDELLTNKTKSCKVPVECKIALNCPKKGSQLIFQSSNYELKETQGSTTCTHDIITIRGYTFDCYRKNGGEYIQFSEVKNRKSTGSENTFASQAKLLKLLTLYYELRTVDVHMCVDAFKEISSELPNSIRTVKFHWISACDCQTIFAVLEAMPHIEGLLFYFNVSFDLAFYTHPAICGLKEFAVCTHTHNTECVFNDEALLQVKWTKCEIPMCKVTGVGFGVFLNEWLEGKRDIEDIVVFISREVKFADLLQGVSQENFRRLTLRMHNDGTVFIERPDGKRIRYSKSQSKDSKYTQLCFKTYQ